MDKIIAICVDCRSEFTQEQIEGASKCPSCKSSCMPMSPDGDVEIKINWFELRVLFMWAERHASTLDHGEEEPSFLSTLYTIAKCIQEQHPTKGPVTLSGEVADLKEMFDGVETVNIPEGGSPSTKVH